MIKRWLIGRSIGVSHRIGTRCQGRRVQVHQAAADTSHGTQNAATRSIEHLYGHGAVGLWVVPPDGLYAVAASPLRVALLLQDAALVAAPGKVVVDLTASLGSSLSGKLAMDATNMAGPLGTAPGFEALRKAGADVVKVFNCTGWENLADVRYGDQVADMFMAGGSEGAKSKVRDLVKAVGFTDAIDLGGDDKVHILEGFALVWIDLAIFQKMGRGIAFKLMRR